MSWLFYSEIPPKNESKKEKIKRLRKENKSYEEYLTLSKKSKIIDLSLAYAVLHSLDYNRETLKELEGEQQ